MKVYSLGLALLASAILSVHAQAALIAYEGFNAPKQASSPSGTPINAPNNAPLSSILSTGTGFDGGWVITNGTGAASRFETGGLSYPATYPGSNVAVGGKGRVTGAPGQNAFLALNLDAAADAAVNSADTVFISWLARNVATPSSTYTGTNSGMPFDAATRTLFNLAAEYPRNSGIRLMNGAPGSNSALGTIGNSGNWNGGGGGAPVQSQYGDGELDPEVVDTWGAFNFNDVNNIFTGNGGTQSAPGSANYNPAPDNYKDVDHLVLRVDATTSTYDLWVNLQADGSSDGHMSWVHTDGGVVPFVMHAFGLEAGNNSSERAPGDMVVDEIYIADNFFSAAGFIAPNGVPEPSALVALCSLLGVGAVARRR